MSEKPTITSPVVANPSQATLVVQGGTTTQVYELAEQPLTLGRRDDNDIVLASRFVSGHHARIEPTDTGHRIVDTESRNGLLYEGQRIQEHTLYNGDVLRIGDPTTGTFVSLTYYNPLTERPDKSEQVAASYPLDPDDPQIVVGRGVHAEVVLDHPQVSRLHATIDRLPDQSRILYDTNSANGTFVNGRRIRQHVLRRGDIVQIGPFKLVYNITSLDQYDERSGLRIDAHHLSREVQRGNETHTILHDVSLSIAPREFIALVGGSGAGKSTLLKALSGYLPATSGHVLVNGNDFYGHFDAYRTILGYVPQDDILHLTLPVERALDYAAQLRMPSDLEASERDRRTEHVITEVEMAPHRATTIAHLSGGQRKRVSIAAELLADPSLFFLDEPTSGLDPGLEKKMMYTLRCLADMGHTIVMVTHATANIVQCDHVAFMAEGRVVFFGPPGDALAFFGVSSGDFADIYTRLDGTTEAHSPAVQRILQNHFADWQQAHPQPDTLVERAEVWEYAYRRSSYYQRYVTQRLTRSARTPHIEQEAPAESGKQHTSLWQQFRVLAWRYLDLLVHDRRNLLLLLLQAPAIALLLLWITPEDALVGVKAADMVQRNEAKTLLFLLAVVSVWFGIINAAREIVKERPIFLRERLANLRIVPYLLSKITVLGILAAVQSALFLLVLQRGVHIPTATGVLLPSLPSLEMYGTLLLSSLAGTALGLLISAAADTPDRAVTVVPLALIPQIVFAGLIFKVQGLTIPLSWLTISRWSLDALGTSVHINGLCHRANLEDFVPCSVPPPDDMFAGAFTHTATHLLSAWGVLVLFVLVCLAATGWLLKRYDERV